MFLILIPSVFIMLLGISELEKFEIINSSAVTQGIVREVKSANAGYSTSKRKVLYTYFNGNSGVSVWKKTDSLRAGDTILVRYSLRFPHLHWIVPDSMAIVQRDL